MYKEIKLKSENLPDNLKNYEVVEHKIGNQTDIENNNNKFFSIELLKVDIDWYCYTNYGRVDNAEYSGAVGLYGPDNEINMRDFFNKKWKEKSKKYKEISFIKASKGSPKARLKTYGVSESEIPDEKKKKLQESKSVKVTKTVIHPTIKKLVNQWYSESSTAIKNNAAVTITSNGIETPLGVLTFDSLNKGKTILGEIGQALQNKDDKEIRKLTSNFYSFIPTKMGRKMNDNDLISTDIIIQQKLDLIQMMADALDVGGSTYTSDDENKYIELGADIEFLEKTHAEWLRIEKKIKETKGSNHYNTTTKVRNVLKIKMQSDRARYDNCKIDNIDELFHGSRNCNMIGIIKSGLKIAPKEAPRSGLAFGFGIYCANSSSKSINYSLYPFPGVEKSDNCFLFITKNRLGKQMETFYGRGNEADVCIKKGYHSVYAKKGQGLIHDEFIFPTIDQVTITHIVELER